MAEKKKRITEEAELNVDTEASEATEGVAEVAEPEKKTEKITLFKDNKDYRDDVFVCVNGKNMLIKRGVEVEVPVSVAKVLRQSMEQDAKTAELMEAQQNKFRESSARV